MPHIVTYDGLTQHGAPTSWRTDMKAAFDRGYHAWFADQMCTVFNMGCPPAPVDEYKSAAAESIEAALKEGVYTDGFDKANTKFVLPSVAQAKSVQQRKAALTATDVSRVLPGKLWPVGNNTLHEVLRWRDGLAGKPPSPLKNWGSEALALMDKALEEDELSAFEVYAPNERDPGMHYPSEHYPNEHYPNNHYPSEHYPSEYYPPDPKYAPSPKPIEVPTFLVHAPADAGKVKHELEGSQPPELLPYDGRGGRRQLQNPGIYPWPSAVYGPNDNRLEILWPSNFVWGWSTLVSTGNRNDRWCSGTMISPTVVLTAAHCVATAGSMGGAGGIDWLAQPQICVRDVQRSTPTAASPTETDCVTNGGILASWRKMTTFVKWARDGDIDWDIAWITLSQPVGYTSGWKGIRTALQPAGTIVNNAGYGGDCASRGADCSDNMKTHWCPIERSCSNSERYYFTCDAIGGMSGSGTYVYYPNKEAPNNRFIIGVLAYALHCGGFNHAVRIRPSILATMCSTTTDMLCF